MHSARPSSFVAPLYHLVGLTVLVASAAAQNLDLLEPAPVPAQVSAPAAPVPTPAPAEPVLLGIQEGETIILPELRGVAFYPTPEAAAAGNPEPGFAIHDLPLLSAEATKVITSLFLDHPVSQPGMSRLALGVRTLLRQAGYPYSLVYLPEQDITEGILRVVVVCSRLESEIAIEGAKYFSAEQYREALRLIPGAPLKEQDLQADVAWLNRNPFRASTLEARAGDEPATTQLVLKVNETRPLRLFTGIDNTGTETTKEDRFTAGLNWGNAFGRGHQLSAQWNSSWDFESFRSVSGSYAMDLPWRHSLSFSGAYSVTNGFVAPPFALKGRSWQVGLNYAVPLESRKAGFTHGLSFGADFKSSDNNFTFAAIPITDNLTHVAQVRAGYTGSLTRDGSRTDFGVTATAAPGGLTSRNEDVFFDISRAGSKADYVYFRANAAHRVSLDSIKKGLNWSLRGQLQFSPVNLIGSEQFGGGGASSVRGYEQGEVFKDNGVLLSQELRLPLLNLGGVGRIQPYIFQDYANLWSTDELPGENAVDLSSVGVGFDYYLGQKASVRAAYGRQLRDSGSSNSGDNSRLHLSANLSF